MIKDLLISKDFVSVYVTLIWIVFWAALIFLFRGYLATVMEALVVRIRKGAKLSIGPVTLEEPPQEIREGGVGTVAVSNGSTALPKNLTEEQINSEYGKLLNEDYFLLHAAQVLQERTSPKSGRYRVRVWVESYDDKHLEDIVQVTYRVWSDFRQPIISTKSRETHFELWVSVYGEFPVLAYIERKGKPGVFVSRYLDLPGRPPD